MRAAWWNWLWGRAPRDLGAAGELAAARFLRRQGYHIVARRARDDLGELDLVAVDHGVVVFVEVKTRRTERTGHPAEAVGPHKQRRLTRAALAYLRRHRLREYPVRFDVVAVWWPPDARRPLIEHFPHAFEAAGSGSFFA
jgi:putative endonuclease